MDTRRLQLLLALSRLGSMRAVAEAHRLTTSTVSQQIAALAKDTGVQLIEPEGRRVRLTPAGRRLADHAVTILAAVDTAWLDLDPGAEPAGRLRVGGFRPESGCPSCRFSLTWLTSIPQWTSRSASTSQSKRLRY